MLLNQENGCSREVGMDGLVVWVWVSSLAQLRQQVVDCVEGGCIHQDLAALGRLPHVADQLQKHRKSRLGGLWRYDAISVSMH